ncbi:MAG: hypothetical protein WBF53_00580 [Litorimonas sp.]
MADADPERCGTIGRYRIGSDTQAKKFLTILDGLPSDVTEDPDLRASVSRIRAYGDGPAPLPQIGLFLTRLKRRVVAALTSRGRLDIHRVCVDELRLVDDYWAVDKRADLRGRRLVLACGASERRKDALATLFSYGLDPARQDRVVLSSDWLSASGQQLDRLFEESPDPHIVIVGGSHSAISSAAALLHRPSASQLGVGAVTILHRNKMTATFASTDEARQCGYRAFGPDDICPVTQRVHALGGFRLESRYLLMQMRGWGGAQPEPRVADHLLSSLTKQGVRRRLNSAMRVISALGYRPDLPRLYVGGEQVMPSGPVFVDARSRLLDARGRPVPGVQAIGLAVGYDLRGRFGEVGFEGQANGLVLWFKEIGETILPASDGAAEWAA